MQPRRKVGFQRCSLEAQLTNEAAARSCLYSATLICDGFKILPGIGNALEIFRIEVEQPAAYSSRMQLKRRAVGSLEAVVRRYPDDLWVPLESPCMHAG